VPAVLLSQPLGPAYAERLGLVTREYEIGESLVLDQTTAEFLEYIGYGHVTADPAAGAGLLFGTGAPSSGLGANGNYYLDTAAQVVYGPKAAGAWPTGVPLANSLVLLGGIHVAPAGPQGIQGLPGPKGDPGVASNVALRQAQDYDDTTAPSTGSVVRWNGAKYAPFQLAATNVGAVATTGAETIAGIKTFSSAPVVPAPTVAGNPVRHDDTRLVDARTPLAHAASHAVGAADVVTPAAIGAAATVHGHTPASIGAAPTVHTHAVGDLNTTGTRDATTFLRGDGTWVTRGIVGGGAVTSNASGDTTITHTLGVVPSYVDVTVRTAGAYLAVVTAATATTFTYRLYLSNAAAVSAAHSIYWRVDP
jgi:hypothetical protein